MKTQIDVRKFQRKLQANGYTLHHMRGSHQIYRNENGRNACYKQQAKRNDCQKTHKGVWFNMKKRIYKYLTECLREIIGIFEYLEGRW